MKRLRLLVASILLTTLNIEALEIDKKSYVYLGYGQKNLTLHDEKSAFSEYALDNKAIDIKVGYGHGINNDYFINGGIEYLQLKQSNMMAITTSIQKRFEIDENIYFSLGLKGGVSYLNWDVALDEAVRAITSTSPLIGVEVGLEFMISDDIALVIGGNYTKYWHETSIPKGTLNTDSAYGIDFTVKFYK